MMPAPRGKERTSFSDRANICFFPSAILIAKNPISSGIAMDNKQDAIHSYSFRDLKNMKVSFLYFLISLPSSPATDLPFISI